MQQARDDEDKQMEIYNMINGDFLTENSDTAISSFGPHRVVPDRWKGMSQAQIKTIRQQQLLQTEQRRVQNLLLNTIFKFMNLCFVLYKFNIYNFLDGYYERRSAKSL